MDQELVDVPPLRVRANAHRAHARIDGLLGYLAAGNYPRDRLLRLVSATDPSVSPARAQWIMLVRAYARDHYADAGFDGLAWKQALLDAVQLLKMIAQESASGNARECWQIRTPWAVIDHRQSNGFIPAQAPRSEGQRLMVMTMDDVKRETRALSRRDWCKLTRVAAKWLSSADPPTLALATGALGALAIAGRLTGNDNLHMGGDPLEWHLHVQWIEPRKGGGPTGEDLTEHWNELEQEGLV